MPHRRNDGDGRRQMVTRRRALVLVLVAAAVLFSGTQAEARGKPSYGCSPGFDLGALTLEQGLELPRIEAGLAAGAYDEAALESKIQRGRPQRRWSDLLPGFLRHRRGAAEPRVTVAVQLQRRR
jgi:hypothetical protein